MVESGNNLSLGTILKQSRESQGYTIAEVVRATKIRYSHIQLIENNEFDKLPERTYTLGYISRYSKFLGLNTKAILSQAEEEYDLKNPVYNNMVQNNRLDKKYNPINVIKENIIDFIFILFSFGLKRYNTNNDPNFNKIPDKPKKRFLLFIGLGLVILVIFVGFFVLKKKGGVLLEADPITINSKVAKELDLNFLQNDINKNNSNTKILNKEDVVVVNKKGNYFEDTIDNESINLYLKNDNTLTNASNNNQFKVKSWPKTSLSSKISLVFNNDVWIRIYDNTKKEVYLDAIFKSGDRFNVPNLPNLLMDVGNYKNMFLIVNEQVIYLSSSTSSSVLKKIILDDNLLLDKYLNR